MDYSLISLLKNDAETAERFLRKIEELKEDKQTLIEAANEYSKQYKEEIEEGTKKRQKLLSEGESKGMTEEEVLKEHGKFLPTIQTPILNFLYFILREADDVDREMRELANKKLGQLYEEDNVLVELNEAEDMFEYLYKNMTHDTFNKVKKLKALSKSSNEEEAFLAYRKCLELCKKYNLEFDKIPCNVGKIT